ncbi:MAG: peptidoglycan DD-metalloendopeptidase family protein [Pseudomonadota bacterium]
MTSTLFWKKTRFWKKSRLPLAFGAAALVLSACGGGNRAAQPQVDIRGTNPSGAATTTTQTTPTQPRTTAGNPAGNSEILQNDGYQSVVAKDGDTVTSLASRAGLSASELGAYNGLQPGQSLRAGDELIVPPQAQQQSSAQTRVVTSTPLETTPLGGGAAGGIAVEDPDLGVEVATADPAGGAAGTGPIVTDGQGQTAGSGRWSPDLAAAAIDRSVGVDENGTLGAPPSSTDPVPPEPQGRRVLESPDLSQYQTDASAPDAAPDPATKPPTAEEVTAAVSSPAVSSAPRVKLLKPVRGPIAVGFNQGSGAAKNDGVDFAAPAGSKVVAAADGEVALVSQSLGGLGTIVLLRHADELLTVYGRVDGVSVAKGDIIRRGQQIGVVSDAAAPAEPRMHFEVRRGATVLDPTQFL